MEQRYSSTPRPGRFTPVKTGYRLYRRLCGPHGRSGRVRKMSPPLGFDPLIVQAWRVAISTELSRPLFRAKACQLSASTSVFPCQYHSTNAPYPSIHLPPTLYNVSLSVLQFSPVSIIPPLLHTDLHLSPTLHVYTLNNGLHSVTRLYVTLYATLYATLYGTLYATLYVTLPLYVTRTTLFNTQKLNFPVQCVYVLRAALTTCRQH